MKDKIKAQIHQSLSEIDPLSWDSWFGEHYPFLRSSFLSGLEETGCTTERSGWQPAHITLSQGEEKLATIPAYIKSHSYGEYVFDWSWADAWQRMGLKYYPKLTTAVPFTPATGPRIWCREGQKQQISKIAITVQSLCASLNLSSWHVLFLEEEDSRSLSKCGMPQRLTTQFHWFNKNYRDFQDFLNRFSSRKRKNLRRERDHINKQGIEFRTVCGEEITIEDWKFFHRCYQTTYAKRSGHGGYLTEAFFVRTCPSLGEAPVMVIATRQGKPIAAALFFQGAKTLYGRYWGCLEEYEYLHFETCYYQGIEYCIKKDLSRFDPGAQGEHKIQRGFEPILTYSNHWIVDERLRPAVESFAEQEREQVQTYLRQASSLLPFKQSD